MWPAGKFWGGEPPPEPLPPDDPGWTAAHWLQPKKWLLVSQPGSPAADLASHANSNERATNTLQNNNQASPTTAQQVSGGLGAQGTTVPARVSDPSPIPNDQPGILANAKITTDTTPAERTLGMEDVMTDETGESSASGRCPIRLDVDQKLGLDHHSPLLMPRRSGPPPYLRRLLDRSHAGEEDRGGAGWCGAPHACAWLRQGPWSRGCGRSTRHDGR